MSYRLREGVDGYSVYTLSWSAFDAAPTLSLFTSSARSRLAGIVQNALTAKEPFTLKPHLDEISNGSWLIREAFLADAALSMLSNKAIDGLTLLATDALYEKVDE